MTQFEIITIFPQMIDSYANESILGRAQKNKLIKITSHDLRKYSKDRHHKVDDTPYGGGPGMVMKVEPFDLALKKIIRRRGALHRRPGKTTRVILTAASGKTFSQADAKRLSKYKQIIFLCGRYEGIDARVEENLVDESFSIGNYVLTGGELPALVMADAIARNIKGVLGASESLEEESHNEDGILEYPQYTKPEVYKSKSSRVDKKSRSIFPLLTKEASPVAGLRPRGARGRSASWIVPAILLSGDHKQINTWRKNQKKSPTLHNSITP